MVLIFFTTINSTHAQVYPDPVIDSLLKSGIELIVKQDYNRAGEIFNSLKKNYPGNPLGNIYLAANKIAEAFDYAEPFDEIYITDNLDSAKILCDILLNEDENNIWYNYFLALANGYSAYYNALEGNLLFAFSTGFTSLQSFDKCLTLNNNFFESYIALGTYEYWKSRKVEFMNWLPFVDDDREDAVSKLKIAVDSASYNSYLAINSLIWIYIDQKKFNEAVLISKNALEKFPHSRSFKWGLARAVEETDPKQAINYYYDILNSYPDGKISRVNEITLKHIIAQRYYDSDDYKSALKLCNEIMSINNLNSFEREVLEDRLERVDKLKTEILHKN